MLPLWISIWPQCFSPHSFLAFFSSFADVVPDRLTDGHTDRQTDRRTGRWSGRRDPNRDARTHLKICMIPFYYFNSLSTKLFFVHFCSFWPLHARPLKPHYRTSEMGLSCLKKTLSGSNHSFTDNQTEWSPEHCMRWKWEIAIFQGQNKEGGVAVATSHGLNDL